MNISRTKCRACRIIAEEVDMLDQVRARNVSLKSFLEDDFCSSLGFNLYPYQWLETLCDEMTEDHLGKRDI